jgi:predicted DNA-binding transcriptional regulator AlpA
MSGRRLLSVGDVAERYGLSRWEVYEPSRLNQLPLIVHPGSRRVMFPSDLLDRFDIGEVELEVLETKNDRGKSGTQEASVSTPSIRSRRSRESVAAI